MISAGTHRLTEGLFDCTTCGAIHLKGFPEPVVVWQVHGESMAESRYDALHSRAVTPMVGRDRELGLLMHCWERVCGGEAQVALISGEAGVGKSRILHALRVTAGAERAVHPDAVLFALPSGERAASGDQLLRAPRRHCAR